MSNNFISVEKMAKSTDIKVKNVKYINIFHFKSSRVYIYIING